MEPYRRRIATAVGAIGLAACDASVAPEAPPTPTTGGESTEHAALATGSASGAEVPLAPAARTASEAIARTFRERDRFARARRLGELLPALGPEGVAGAVAMLRDPTLDTGPAEFVLLLRYWARHEPEQATRWAVEESPTGIRFSAILSSLDLWAEADPQAALAAVGEWELDRPRERAPVQIALVNGWFERDPDEVARHILEHEMGFARLRRLKTYLRLLVQRQGIDAALRWADSVPDDDPVLKQDVNRQVAAIVPFFDLAAALRWCEARCDGPHTKDVRTIIARRWVSLGEGAEALAWLGTAPEGSERDRALSQVFSAWAEDRSEEATAWLERRAAAEDAEPWLPALFPAYALRLAPESPAVAIEWAARIPDEGLRERMLIRVARTWRLQDQAAADAWLRESPLSEEARGQVTPGAASESDRPSG